MLLIITGLFSIPVFAEPAADGTALADQTAVVDPNDPFPDIDSVLILDPRTGDVIFEKNADVTRYPASTTKILTALIALERCQLDEQVTISYNASHTEGSRIYLLEGEVVTIEQLLYALLVESANDAAIALAEHIGGSVEAFADIMNARAQELGMVNSHFVTPNGLHDDLHYVTPRDLSLVAMEAMKNETFRTMVTTYKYVMGPTNMQSETRYLYNSNKMLVGGPKEYEGIQGIKTGYTSVAQASLVAQAERNGMRVMAVIMHTDHYTLFDKMTNVLNYAYNNFAPVNIVPAGQVAKQAKIKKGSENKVPLQLNDAVNVIAKVVDGVADCNVSDYSYKVKTAALTAPVTAGDKGGTLTLYRKGEAISTYDLYVMEDVPLSGIQKFVKWWKESLPGFFKVVIVLVILVAAAYVTLMVLVKKRQKEQMKKRMELREKRRRISEEDDESSKSS